jgi:pilus assembly protein Flp/PilA
MRVALTYSFLTHINSPNGNYFNNNILTKAHSIPSKAHASAYTKRNKAMRQISRKIGKWFSIESERGVTAIEYGLLASLIALAIIVAVTLVGTNLSTLFNTIATKVKGS